MKSSARNQLVGTIQSMTTDGFYSKIHLNLASGHEIVAMIGSDRCQSLGLAVGHTAVILIKSTSIIIATDLEHIRLSAHNQLKGMISNVDRGAVNSVVSLDLGHGLELTAGITMQSTERLDLHPGQYATAVFEASSVMLGVLA